MVEHRDRLADFLGHEPQTNEVRRAICLAPGFLTIARETGLPIRAFEIAASAGLNLNWDRFHYDFGEAQWGDEAASVRLDTDWTGPAPPVDAQVQVIERAACDRRPIDLRDPAERRRPRARRARLTRRRRRLRCARRACTTSAPPPWSKKCSRRGRRRSAGRRPRRALGDGGLARCGAAGR